MKIPGWFDIDRYKLGDTGREGIHRAMLAVLDRVPLYRIAADLPARQLAQQIQQDLLRLSKHPSCWVDDEAREPLPDRVVLCRAIMLPSFDLTSMRAALYRTGTAPSVDPTSVRAEAQEAAQQALRHWSADPYRRADQETQAALLGALPAVPHNAIQKFEMLLEKSEEDEREASQQELQWIVASFAHLPAGEQRQAVVEGVGGLCQNQGSSEEGMDLLEPETPARLGKLLDYRVAAYMDLTIWGALINSPLSAKDLGQVHSDLWPDGPGWRSIGPLLDRLKGGELGFYTQWDKGKAFIDGQRRKRRKKRT